MLFHAIVYQQCSVDIYASTLSNKPSPVHFDLDIATGQHAVRSPLIHECFGCVDVISHALLKHRQALRHDRGQR